MEVQERPGAAGEAARPALSELRKPAQLDQQTRQTIKIILYCVPHTLSMVSGALACKPDPRVGMRTRGHRSTSRHALLASLGWTPTRSESRGSCTTGGVSKCPRAGPEPPSIANDRHQQQTVNLKLTRGLSPRATHGNPLVMRRSPVRFRWAAQVKGRISLVSSEFVARPGRASRNCVHRVPAP